MAWDTGSEPRIIIGERGIRNTEPRLLFFLQRQMLVSWQPSLSLSLSSPADDDDDPHHHHHHHQRPFFGPPKRRALLPCCLACTRRTLTHEPWHARSRSAFVPTPAHEQYIYPRSEERGLCQSEKHFRVRFVERGQPQA